MPAEIKHGGGLVRNKLAEVVPLSTPYSAYVYPTNCCNFRCAYCAHSMSSQELQERYNFAKDTMSLETYSKTIDQLAAFPEKLKVLSLTGVGEPLLNKNIAKMVGIASATKRFENVEIISNVSLLTPEMSDALLDNGLNTLRVSLQGITSKKYKEVADVDIDFSELMDNLRYFYSKKGETGLFVKILDAALDENEEEKFYELFSDCCDRMFVEKMQPTYAGVELTDTMETGCDRYGREIKERDVCPLPFITLGVLPNGDVQPCDNLYKPVILGNVHETSIVTMWNGDLLRNFRKQQLRGDRKKNPMCALCCAPNDVSHPEDVLDDDALEVLKKLK